jgi:hypothetical protein
MGCVYFSVPNIGTALISEGIGDLITSMRGILSRNFSWEDYAIQKAVSITITLATAGFRKINVNMPKSNLTTAIESIDVNILNMASNSTNKSGTIVIKNTNKLV